MMSEQPPARGRKARETDPGPRRGWGLVVLCAAFFVVVSDSTIVYTALPAIERELGFSPGRVQWVIIAYALTSGGLLLLGGRCADLLGHRRVFTSGVGAFTGASLLCGLAWSSGVLVAARVIEGLGAAVMVPAALSLLIRTFPEGAERNKALGVWGSLGGIGATAGLLLGGPLTDGLGWPWIFFLNIPVGGAVLALAPRLLPDSRDPRHQNSLDIPGALTITLALLTLIYAVVEAPNVGWTAARTVALLGVAVALAGLFVLVERRATAPSYRCASSARGRWSGATSWC
nr:MFS transporter [Egibacter rhizosphaerae]